MTPQAVAEVPAPELVDLVELEVRELLTRHQFDGDHTPVVKGSALGAVQGEPQWLAAIQALIETPDAHLPLPPPAQELPFLLPIEDARRLEVRGTVVTGRIETGVIRAGDDVDVIGLGLDQSSRVIELETRPRGQELAVAGETVRLRLGPAREEIVRGQILAAPGGVRSHHRFRAEVYVLRRDEGGRHTPYHRALRRGLTLPFHQADRHRLDADGRLPGGALADGDEPVRMAGRSAPSTLQLATIVSAAT